MNKNNTTLTKDIETLIVRYFDGSITPEEKAQLIAWYNQNDENKARFTQLTLIRQTTHPVFDPDEIDVGAAEKNVWRRLRKRGGYTLSPVLVWWQKAAAVLLIPVVLLSVYLLTDNGRLQRKQSGMQEVTALPGTRTKIELPDGTRVWLNSNSTIAYPVAFEKKNRRITLSGEGYFHVKADKKRPFHILLNGIQVVITGTELNVEAYRGDSINTVALTGGAASIIAGDNEIALKPNQCFSYNIRTRQYEIKESDSALFGTWKEGILIFRDETLQNVFKRIGRTFNVNIRVKDTRLANQKYRATFEGESLPQILEAISLSAPIRYHHTEETAGGKSSEIIEVYPR